METTLDKTAIQQIVDLSAIQARPSIITNGAGQQSAPFIPLPHGAQLHDVSHLFPPQFIQQSVTLLDAGSFIDYVNRFKNEDTLIFAKVGADMATFTAILDYHGPMIDDRYLPRRCKHIASFTTQPTADWQTWLAANRKEMDQVQFATWIEDNIRFFVKPEGKAGENIPTGTDLLELVTTLEGKQDVRFTSGMRLQNGANELNYEEDVQLSGSSGTKAGKIKIPQRIMAGIVPFHGCPAYRLEARLKYRIASRKITFWFETVNLAGNTRDALLLICKEIGSPVKPDEKGARPGTGIIPLLGSAC